MSDIKYISNKRESGDVKHKIDTVAMKCNICYKLNQTFVINRSIFYKVQKLARKFICDENKSTSTSLMFSKSKLNKICAYKDFLKI